MKRPLSQQIHCNQPQGLSLFLTTILVLSLLLSPSGCSKRDVQTRPSSTGSQLPYDSGGILQPSFQPAVFPLFNTDYYPFLIKASETAAHSLEVILYQVRFSLRYADSPANCLVSALARAARRGVKVRLLIEASDWNPENSLANKLVGELLSASGVDVRYDSPTVNSHAKLFLADDSTVILGSSNWSHFSLTRNNEANVVIIDDRTHAEFRRYFERLFSSGTKAYPLVYDSCTKKGPESDQARTQECCQVSATLVDIDDHSSDRGAFKLTFDSGLSCNLSPAQAEEWFAAFGDFPRTLHGRQLKVLLTWSNVQGWSQSDRQEGCRILSIDNPSLAVSSAFREEIWHCRSQEPRNISGESAQWLPAESIEPLVDASYLPGLLRLLESATHSIEIAQIQSDFFSPTLQLGVPATNAILAALLNAMQRGVTVEFLTDCREDDMSNRKKAFLLRLSSAGGKVYCDDEMTTTHCKMLIIDGQKVIVGSTNWSLPALTQNHETSVCITSSALANRFTHYFEEIRRNRVMLDRPGSSRRRHENRRQFPSCGVP